jgi:serine/threonine-protein kinase
MVLPGAGVDHKYRALLAITNALIARAAVIPSSARRSAAVSSLAVLPTIGLTWLFHSAAGRSDGSALVPTLVATLWCGVAIAASAVTSYTIYGLRQRVREVLQLGQYTLEEKVGEGGMGEVYRARHAMLRRPTAVKLLRPGLSGEEGLQRFEREVQLTSILTHPNTISIFDYGRTADGVFYYAMEYLEGVTLDRLVRQQGPQPAARVVHILRQTCGSLAEAHGIGLIHRDIKPANIILCERGGVPDVVKVFDFGLVLQEGDPSSARPDEIAGTPHFLPPEAITAPRSLDARSDLYALGAVGYYLLSGSYPFSARSTTELFAHHLKTVPPPPSVRLGRALPADLDAVILKCLEKDPANRPASARDLDARLSACQEVGAWSEADARAASNPPAAREGESVGVGARSLTVDLRERTFGLSTLREARRP